MTFKKLMYLWMSFQVIPGSVSRYEKWRKKAKPGWWKDQPSHLSPTFVTIPEHSRRHICPWFFSYALLSASHHLSFPPFFFPLFQFSVLPVLLILSELASLIDCHQVQGYVFVLEKGLGRWGWQVQVLSWQVQCQGRFCIFNSLFSSSP